MSIAADVMRQFWIAGLNDVTGNVVQGLRGWLANGNYQIYDPLEANSFTLNISDVSPLLSAFAYDCSRMAIGSFESIHDISRDDSFPKSTAWLVVRTYYAAFFAAHASLRMFGISCSQLDSITTNEIYKIADIFSQTNNIGSILKGFYVCKYDVSSKKITCKRDTSGAGVHEAFWKVFNQVMRSLSIEILKNSRFPKWDQEVAVKIAGPVSLTCLTPSGSG